MTKTAKINKEKVVRYENWTNNETGEIKPFAVVDRQVNGDTNWWKLWITDLLITLGLIGNVKIKVLMYIIDNISPYDNTFGGTIREIAKNCDVSPTTVQRVIQVLTNEANFLVKIRIGTYQINPSILAKGNHQKRVGLMIKYEKAKSQNDKTDNGDVS